MKKFSYLPGFVLIVVAISRAAWSVQWSVTDVSLVAAGLAIVAASLVLNRREIADWFRDPRGIFAVNTSLSLVFLVGILVLINMLTWYRPFRADLTASGRNSLTAETQQLLADLKTDVALRQFGRVRDPKVDQILASFAQAGPRLRVEFVDADRQAREARELGIVRSGTVVVSVGAKYRKVEEVTEQSLDTAILQVTSDTMPVVCFVTGHGERALTDTSGVGLSRFGDILKASNYDVRAISLL
ncbi:MAG: Gldg family protein, partial [Acidobacteria bacterium]|nr:Gldg family protein [Acidobacteriota bacterium]